MPGINQQTFRTGAPAGLPATGEVALQFGGGGQGYVLDPSGALITLGPQDTKSRLRGQAASYVGTDFADYIADWIHSAEGVASIGFVGVTPAIVQTGRTGGGKVDLDMAGAGGVVEYHPAASFGQSIVTGLVADANSDRWFSAWRGSISAVSAAGEIALCMLTRLGVSAATDGATNAYLYLGFNGGVSTTNLTLTSWDATTKRTLATNVANPSSGLNDEHVIAMGYDGNWNLDIIVDGVVKQTLNVASLAPLPAQAAPMFLMRTTTAAHNTVRMDYFYAAGPRL